MSFNVRSPLNDTVHERAMALRDRHETELRKAQQIREDEDMPTTPTGIKRARLRTDEAKSAVGSLNQRLDAALDEVRVAMERERQQAEAVRTQRSDDARRASALGGDR